MTETHTGEPSELARWLEARAREEGFDTVGIVPARDLDTAALKERLGGFLANGYHGDMAWLERNAEKRASAAALWPDVRSIVMLALNYGPTCDPLAVLGEKQRGAISVYAQGADYHDIVKAKLKALARDFIQQAGGEVKVFVDTAPVMEKPIAEAAGLGWQGKHTNLVSRRFGSWLFLGSMFTTVELAASAAAASHCGRCRRCLDVCPTKAFPAPFQLDARRCISYLTIEHKGHIPAEFREPMGNRVYGCDDCLAVCPWNKFARAAAEARLTPRPSAANPPLQELLSLDDAAFRARFSGAPIKRTGRDRFVRNCLIAAGNSAAPELLPHIWRLMGDASPLVRAMAAWAAGRFMARGQVDLAEVLAHRPEAEHDDEFRQEWEALLSHDGR